jgi:hypothetical protein
MKVSLKSTGPGGIGGKVRARFNLKHMEYEGGYRHDVAEV